MKFLYFCFFDGLTCFGISWTRFGYFWKLCACLLICVWHKFCRRSISRANTWNLIKFQNLDINKYWLCLAIRDQQVALLSMFFKISVIAISWELMHGIPPKLHMVLDLDIDRCWFNFDIDSSSKGALISYVWEKMAAALTLKY